MKHQTKMIKVLYILLPLTLCFIWGNSLMPASISGALSGWVKEMLHHFSSSAGVAGLSGDGILRKLAHASEFALLGGELSLLFRLQGKGHRWPDLLLLGLMVALTDETLQLFIAGRAGLVKDIWIDFGGFLFGCLLIKLFFSKNT